MKVNEVPQDRGMINDQRHEICYAVDESGRYVLAPSAGWEPKNLANGQAWERIRTQVVATLEKIRAGRLSPLAFHMVNNQMTSGLLAKYVGCSRWRVWRHLRPAGFGRLGQEMLARYADLFEIDVERLKTVPEIDPFEFQPHRRGPENRMPCGTAGAEPTQTLKSKMKS
jgi:hypothetical protein